MGKNTPDRQKFIIDNLKVELDTVDDLSMEENSVSAVTRKDTLVKVTGMYKDWFLDYASYVILERAVPELKMVLNLFKEEFFIL